MRTPAAGRATAPAARTAENTRVRASLRTTFELFMRGCCVAVRCLNIRTHHAVGAARRRIEVRRRRHRIWIRDADRRRLRRHVRLLLLLLLLRQLLRLRLRWR